MLCHVGPEEKLVEIEATLVIPARRDDGRRRRVYVATSPDIANVIPHADGAVRVSRSPSWCGFAGTALTVSQADARSPDRGFVA
jgi:hypothetical protein